MDVSQFGINEKKRNNDLNVFVSIFVLFIAISASMIMVFGYGDTDTYGGLFVLPVCYGISFFMAVSTSGRNIFGSLVSILLIGGYFIKMVLTPFLFAVGGYQSFIPGTFSRESLTKATVLMCLETITVFLTMYYCLKKNRSFVPVELKIQDYNTRKLNRIIFLLFAFLVFAYVAIPAISEIYIFLPTANFNEIAHIRWDNETIVARGSIDRYIYSLFGFIWPIFRLIVPSLMIVHFYKKYNGSNPGMFLSFCCLILPAILLGGDNISPFIGIFVGVIVIYKLYGKKAARWLLLIGIFTGILLIIVVVSKIVDMILWKGSSGIAVVAQLLHNYFPGFDNMAVVFDMNKNNIFSTMFFDLYYAIPFRKTLFGLEGKYIQDLFKIHTLTGGQIVPFTGQFAYYFSFLSIFFTGLFVKIAYNAERKSKNSDNFWLYFINMYISIYTAMALSIYSFSIYMSGVINVILPTWIILNSIKKRRQRKGIE